MQRAQKRQQSKVAAATKATKAPKQQKKRAQKKVVTKTPKRSMGHVAPAAPASTEHGLADRFTQQQQQVLNKLKKTTSAEFDQVESTFFNDQAQYDDAEAQAALKDSLTGAAPEYGWYQKPDYPLSPKLSTCITGVPAIPNGREVLDNLLVNTVIMAKQKHDQDGHYIWSSIHNNAIFRLQVLRKFPNDDNMVERIIGAGQIEELIEQQEDEMTLFQTLTLKDGPNLDPEILRGAAPAFGSTNPKAETKILPLPEEVAKEVASGKVTINPYHPTKPLSRKFVQHIGFGDLITPEQHAKYDELLALNEEEQQKAAKNLPNIGKIISSDLQDSFLQNRYPEGLPDSFFEFFETSAYVHPELDTKFVESFKEAFEVHIRKL